ncbi:MAG: type I restriction-modification enzyme R subunit C-terminal domain-containing protein, partial [Bacteroidota bacterium]
REVYNDEWWQYITANKLELLRLKVAPLLRFASAGNLAEAFFTSKMERLSLAVLQRRDTTNQSDSIKEDIDLLPRNLSQVQPVVPLINDMLSMAWWQEITTHSVDNARKQLAPLMKYRRERPSLVVELGLEDVIDSRRWVILKQGGQKLMVEEYKAKVEEKIQKLAQQHPTIQSLLKGEKVTIQDLLHLESTLETELAGDELMLTEDNMIKAFGVRIGSLTDFLKYVLQLEHLPNFEELVRRSFDAFILEHNYNADQTRFLRTVQSVFIQKRKLVVDDLYEAPFTNFGMNAVEKLFSEEEVEEILEMTKKLIA